METKELNQPQIGVFFNDQENKATFTLEICSKGDYFETIRHLLDLLGSIDDDFCDRDKRYCVCRLISSMLPNEKQVSNMGEIESLENRINILEKNIEANIQFIKKIQGRE